MKMTCSYITQPVAELITIESAKNYLRIDGTKEDVLIGEVIKSKRDEIETYLARTLLARDVLIAIAKVCRVIQVPVLPVLEIRSIKYYREGTGGVELVALPSTAYRLQEHQGCIIIDDVSVLSDMVPDTEIEITVSTGYASIDLIPSTVTDAMRLMIREGYDIRCNREIDPKYTTAAYQLLDPHRNKRIL